MTLAHTRLEDAEMDGDRLMAVKEAVREDLLTLLSRARSLSIGMASEFRDPLMDELTKCFHPDQAAGDLLTDATHPVEVALRSRAIDADTIRQAAE